MQAPPGKGRGLWASPLEILPPFHSKFSQQTCEDNVIIILQNRMSRLSGLPKITQQVRDRAESPSLVFGLGDTAS